MFQNTETGKSDKSPESNEVLAFQRSICLFLLMTNTEINPSEFIARQRNYNAWQEDKIMKTLNQRIRCIYII